MSENNGQSWVAVIKQYNRPDLRKSIWQIVNSLGPYIAMWVLMYYSLGISYWITLGLSIIAAGFLVRIFIIFHDCGHGSFFSSQKANRVLGTIFGSLVFTPNDRWHNDHALHHNTVGNLDKRGNGDIWTVTVDEYRAMSGWNRFLYRLYRHPVFLFGIAPILLFVIWFRFPKKGMTRKELGNQNLSNLIILVIAATLILLMGWKAYLMIQLPVIYLATTTGLWLFYVQHQFDEVIWTRQGSWDYRKMALEGSSFLKLPRILQFFSGNIGFHHVHHLGPKIPNYNLEKCHKKNPMFRSIRPVSPLKGIRTLKFRLWDEKTGRLITLRQYRKIINLAAI
jgi:omega-6 fatty acid desaturase (delta-12 desaturase)